MSKVSLSVGVVFVFRRRSTVCHFAEVQRSGNGVNNRNEEGLRYCIIVIILISNFGSSVAKTGSMIIDVNTIRLGEMIRDVAQATFGFYSIGKTSEQSSIRERKN